MRERDRNRMKKRENKMPEPSRAAFLIKLCQINNIYRDGMRKRDKDKKRER